MKAATEKRRQADADEFLKIADRRTEGRIRISTDKLTHYRLAIAGQLGKGNLDCDRIVKRSQVKDLGECRYSPPNFLAVAKNRVWGLPDPRLIAASLVKPQDLTMRMGMRRLTRLTNGF